MSTQSASSEAPHPEEKKETALESLASMCTVLVVGLFVMAFLFQNFVIPSGSMLNTLLIGDHLVVDRGTFAPVTRWAPFDHKRAVQRGDVIVFYKPYSESPDLILVKRAIGVAGDRIHLRGGVVYLNGVAQNEPYAIQPQAGMEDPSRDDFPSDIAGMSRQASGDLAALADCDRPECILQKTIDNRTITWVDVMPDSIQGDDLVVPAGSVFAMGDNRTQSLDSRYWGVVPLANVLGRPMFVYWSFETPADEEAKTGLANEVGSMVHVVTHFVTQTRWSRTFHVIR